MAEGGRQGHDEGVEGLLGKSAEITGRDQDPPVWSGHRDLHLSGQTSPKS